MLISKCQLKHLFCFINKISFMLLIWYSYSIIFIFYWFICYLELICIGHNYARNSIAFYLHSAYCQSSISFGLSRLAQLLLHFIASCFFRIGNFSKAIFRIAYTMFYSQWYLFFLNFSQVFFSEFKGSWEKYAENYCFVSNAYYVPFKDEIPRDLIQRQDQISYYRYLLINWNASYFIFQVGFLSY